ncbi:MAG: glycosyltransferase family 2 protein [Bacilli bacterium]|nr:glycosyltransferase family 2 protein [Bacilli bacterium]
MNKDLVSVIIPIYNAEKYIIETIESVLNQSYNNIEVILVNDKSTDNSKKVCKKYIKNNVIWIDLKQNSKAATARNEGIKKAKGRFICFIDADDLWENTKIEKQVNFMKKNNCAFSFTGYEFADKYCIPNGKKVFVPYKINYKAALKNTTISTITVMFDMNKLTKEDIFMPNVASEDTATWWKVLKKIDYAYGLNEILSYYRRDNNTLSSNKIVAIKRIWNLYRNVEHLNIFYSIYNFIFYAFNALRRRI